MDSHDRTRILCLGAGFTSSYLARNFDADVTFLSRELYGDLTPYDARKDFEPHVILDSIPPVHDGVLLNPLYRDTVLKFPRALYVHLSSTSVYDRDEPVVTEMTEPLPDERGRKRLDLEDVILSVLPETLILRCGGIYGPDRCLPLSIRRGETAHVPSENRYVARIHVHDLCRIVCAAASRLLSGRESTGSLPSLFPGFARKNLILAVDPQPSPTAETLEFVYKEWGFSVPRIPSGAPMGRRIKSLYTDLLGGYSYPDYRTGFRDSMSRSRV